MNEAATTERATQKRRGLRSAESGVALLIAIFVLMLVSVIAISLIVSSGTETALASNYRSSATVYYAATAGLEEARQRLRSKSPDYFNNTTANFMPPTGTPLPLTSVRYIVNTSGGDNPVPNDPANAYYDTEYGKEFAPNAITGVPDVQVIPSISGTNAAGLPGPVFKWVRINAVTEASLNIDVNHDGIKDQNTLYYDPNHTDAHGNPQPSLIVGTSPTAVQALEITSLAVLPNGSQKMLQYVVWPSSVTLPPFPAAVTLVGNNVDYTGPAGAPAWFGNGNDTIALGSCAPGPAVYAVGYSNNSPGDASYSNIHTGSFTAQPANYPGAGGTPSLGFIGSAIPANFQTEAGLNSVVQNIIQNQLYDVLINGNAKGADLPNAMSPTNPMTVVVNGNLDLANSFHRSGYGLLIVTGNFNYDPDSSWYGMVLVIGQGTTSAISGKAGDNGKIVGALFAAKTVGSPLSGGSAMPGTGLPDSGDNNVEFPDAVGTFMNGSGIYYSSCWIKAATPPGSFRVISFREIPQ
jgi:hypothetical protein